MKSSQIINPKKFDQIASIGDVTPPRSLNWKDKILFTFLSIARKEPIGNQIRFDVRILYPRNRGALNIADVFSSMLVYLLKEDSRLPNSPFGEIHYDQKDPIGSFKSIISNDISNPHCIKIIIITEDIKLEEHPNLQHELNQCAEIKGSSAGKILPIFLCSDQWWEQNKKNKDFMYEFNGISSINNSSLALGFEKFQSDVLALIKNKILHPSF